MLYLCRDFLIINITKRTNNYGNNDFTTNER